MEKSISIDGLPVLVQEKQDAKHGQTILFDKPIASGRHTLGVTLVFSNKTWIGGGPVYNFTARILIVIFML